MDRHRITVAPDRLQQDAAAPRSRARWLAAFAIMALLAGCATAPAPSQTAAADPKNGDGLGGTGITDHKTADARNGDGLGGTGIIGTISGFGSILVNGLKLEFDRSTAVETDGRPASLNELRIGQVIEGVARSRDGKLQLDTLQIHHAVSGPIASINHAGQTMTVLGQTVRLNLAGDKTAIAAFRTLQAGDMVSVSGLRTNDGTIIASRVDQHQDDGRVLVRGEVTGLSGGRLQVGALEVALTPDITITAPSVGGRVLIAGRMINGTFVPDVITGGAGLPFRDKVHDVSLEGYAPAQGPLALHGVTVEGAALPPDVGANDRIVVTGQITGPDRIAASAISKVRTIVTIMKAQGSLRPAALRPDTMRPERIAPVRPGIERPEVARPDVPEAVRPSIERPNVDRPQPERPQVERPGSFTGV